MVGTPIRLIPAILVAWLLSFAAVDLAAEPATPVCSLAVDRKDDRLVISWPATIAGKPSVLAVYSDANRPVARYSDISPLQPEGWKVKPETRESWLPVVDIEIDNDMEAVVELSHAAGAQVAWNGWAWPEIAPAQQVLRFPASRVLQWENTLWIDRAEPRITSFSLRKPARAASGDRVRQTVELRLLNREWSGRMELLGTDGRVLANAKVDRITPPTGKRPVAAGLRPDRLKAALAAAIGHTLRSQVVDPRDPMRGGLYVFYDLDARTYRTSHWVWAWGPSVGLLLKSREMPELAQRWGDARLLAVAREIGEASLRTVQIGENNPVRDIPISRWDRSPAMDLGHKLAVTPCDAAFLAGWAWVRLAEATGDEKWRHATERLVDALDRLMNQYPVPPQNYWPHEARWSMSVIDEAGFGTEVFDAMFRATGDPRMRELGRRYMDQHLAALGREDGLWDREHFFGGRRNTPPARMTRGLGWPMEGLLAAHRLLADDGRYLVLAQRMAEHLLAAQRPEGYWVHRFDQPADQWGIGTKGTALWCWLFYELHRHTGDPRHLAAARRALAWLLDQQQFGGDPRAEGGLVAVSPHSAVGYRPWFRVTSSYGAAYFGLAMMEELRLQRFGTPSH